MPWVRIPSSSPPAPSLFRVEIGVANRSLEFRRKDTSLGLLGHILRFGGYIDPRGTHPNHRTSGGGPGAQTGLITPALYNIERTWADSEDLPSNDPW